MRRRGAIVLTNDDGIDSPGLRALASAIEAAWGKPPIIVAPDRCYSSCSQQVTTDRSIVVVERRPDEFLVSGSPADCARLARTTLVPDCSLVIAGINHGGNMGHDIYLSGTVGAAREAAVLGINAMAISQYLRRDLPMDWDRAARWAVSVVRELLEHENEDIKLWNINLPHLPPGEREMPAVVRCRPCPRPLPMAYTLKDGGYHFDGGLYHTRPQDAGTDVSACFGGAIAVSALPAPPSGPYDGT